MTDIYGTFNSTNVNAIELDGGRTESYVVQEDAVEITQQVVKKINTSLVCAIRQEIQFRAGISSYNVCSIQQEVANIISSRDVCKLPQIVIDLSAETFFNKNGYRPQITIASRLIPDSMIAGDFQIIKEENQNNQAVIGLIVQDPVGFIDEVWGQAITIDYISNTGSYRLFTGVVSIPEIDLINRRVKITCSNNRDEIINNTMQYLLPTIGRYSSDVQGSITDVASEMKLRLTTVQKSLDFNGYNTPVLTSWFAKSVPDLNFGADQIYYRQPKIVWQDRTKIKNYEDINITYQYTRLYHYSQNFTWNFPYEFCEFLHYQYSLPSLTMIEDAIKGAGWKTSSSIIFTEVFPPGACSFGAFVVQWNYSGLQNTGRQSVKFDEFGNVVSDPNGNDTFTYTPFTKQTDLSQVYTIGAEWSAATRFSQFVTENYSLVVHASQSEAQFGHVAEVNKTAIKEDFDASEWEAFKTITPEPANAVACGTNCYYFNESTNPLALTNAILTAVDKAKTNIYYTHRNTFVIAETPIKPYLELSHTVKFEADLITAKGKVQKIVHTIAIGEGKGSSTEITLALFRSQGSATETPTYAPPRPSDTITIPNNNVSLGNHYAIDSPTYTGYIGNKFGPSSNPLSLVGARSDVTEQFRVDTPSIPDAYRKVRNITGSSITFDLSIPNDLLEVVLT